MRARNFTNNPAGVLLVAGAASMATAGATMSLGEDFSSFTPGPVDGQQGWFSPAGNEAVVTGAADRAVRYERASEFVAPEWGVVSPEFQGGYGLLEFDVRVMPGSDDELGESPQVATEDPLTGYLNTRVEFTDAGEIYIYEAESWSGFSEPAEAAGTFTSGEAFRLGIETTPEGIVRVYKDGVAIGEAPELHAALLGVDRAGRIGRLAVWNAGGAFGPGEESAIEIDSITFTPSACATDADGDGVTGTGELGALLARWGSELPGGPADVDGDGVVGSDDLAALLATWGACGG